MDYKSVSVYVTLKNDLFILSNGISSKWGGATIELEVYHFLASGFTDEMLESNVFQAFERWNAVEPSEELKPTAIEKILKVKGYQKAVKQMRFVSVQWDSDDGYSVIPTENRGKNGFVYLEAEAINLGHNIKSGDLALALRSAISLSK